MIDVMVEQAYVVSNRAVCKFGNTTSLTWYVREDRRREICKVEKFDDPAHFSKLYLTNILLGILELSSMKTITKTLDWDVLFRLHWKPVMCSSPYHSMALCGAPIRSPSLTTVCVYSNKTKASNYI